MGNAASLRSLSPFIEPDVRISHIRLCAWKGEKTVSQHHRYFCFWLRTDSPAMSPVRLLCPQQQTFERQCPLIDEFCLLHLQEQTFLVVSPKVRS